MNPLISKHFRLVEEWLLQSPAVASYEVIRKEIAPTDGKLRVKVVFANGSNAELFEYMTVSEGKLNLSKYSFHWQDAQGNLKCRWDNAPHHLELPKSPHHRHFADQSVNSIPHVPDIFDFLQEIEESHRGS